MAEKPQFGPVTLLRGDEKFAAEVNGSLEKNLSNAAWQADRFGRSKTLIVNVQCPDVRYHHPLDAKAQEELTTELREMLAVVAITDFGGGTDPIALRKAMPENKRVVFLYQPHARCISPDGEIVEGCGAQNAKSALEELPPDLAKAIYKSVLGKTTPEHASFLVKSLEKLELGEGVVAPFLHQDRAIANDLVDSKGESRSLRLAKFLTSIAGERFAKDFQGLSQGVDTESQDASLISVEAGADLIKFGGLATLLNDPDSSSGRPFNINTGKSQLNISGGLIKQQYPHIAHHHNPHNFASLNGLVISAPSEALADVEKAVRAHVGDGFKNVAVIDSSALTKLIK